ncbi:site-specific integrase [Polynucleobacter sp. JS-Polo-80-F4]|uniref:tyrosine-type recombinase/integrase n=1 Tax=Polynucleobacter sp. JS-Polo-80-F4 TaxID=2576918 RepID=UPI001C0B9A2C|nr:site-specific integrase [Polynucleobacter sp. JS-Polo-80-F4]MBU3617338.1 tyrosine-type recombinase/integrase [Polynucleobacter sp. JS-Polo-80-F4]
MVQDWYKMPKIAKPLSALEVKRLNKVGSHAVGTVKGLCLSITKAETKSWVFRVSYGGGRRKIGLGGYPTVSLAQAIEKARQINSEIGNGIDPIQAKKTIKSNLIADRAKAKTFEDCSKMFLATRTFSNVKHGKQWEATLKTYAYPHIGSMLVGDIGIAHIKSVLDPIWKSKTVTASRVQGRIKSIIDYAIVSGYREKANPAIWDGFLDSIYQSPKKLKDVEHMDSLPYAKLYEFLNALRKHNSISAKALEFLILTSVRSDSVRSATWKQIDFEAQVWTVPKIFTKTKKRDHTVPLLTQAIALLKSMPTFNGTDLVFPSAGLKKLSDSTISKLMREMYKNKEFADKAVPHGFRSTFSTWRLEKTNYSQELGELSLMHEVGDSVYKAYQRSDGLERRRAIMQDWANFMNRPFVSVTTNDMNVVLINKAKLA